MKKPILIVALIAAVLSMFYALAQPKPQSSHEPHDPFKGIAYFQHPVTGKLALYIAYELLPNRLYRFEVTTDGVNFRPLSTRNTSGMTHTVYESFNVQDPCFGLWPRIIDLGPSP